MGIHTVAEAERSLADLIDLALQGEEVVITKDGHPVVEIKALAESRPAPQRSPAERGADLEWLRARRVRQSKPGPDAGTLISQMRDEDWR